MIRPQRRLLSKVIDPRSRLVAAVAIACLVYLATYALETGLRISLAYDLAVGTYLALHAVRINQVTAEEIRDYYQDREPSNRFVIFAALAFSSFSMVAVGLMSDLSRRWTPWHRSLHTLSSLVAIVLSWILLHVFYAFYYAHRYYDVDEQDPEFPLRKGLRFPDEEPPDYWDFLYYSFTIAMCYQTSDVTVTSRSMRRITLFHAVISFLYVTAILGLVINLLSNDI